MKKLILAIAVIALTAGHSIASIAVIGGLSRRHTIGPGEEYEGVIMVRNLSDRQQEVRVYLRDFRRTLEGSRYSEPGSSDRSNAPWVSFNPDIFTLPPGGVERIYYTIKVPEDEEVRGTYWSMAMVEPIRTPDPEEVETAEGKVGLRIRSVTRTGIHMVTNIGETGERDIRIMDRTLVQDDDGRVFLQLDIENTGERGIGARIWAELYNEEGMQVGRFSAESARMGLLPGNSSRQKIDLTAVPPGSYQALVIIDDDSEEVFGAQLSFTLKEAEEEDEVEIDTN